MIHKVLCGLIITVLLAPAMAQAEDPGGLVISQIQISGPAGANDEFIEIYNPTDQAINLEGWSLQYKSTSGSFPLVSKKNLHGFSLESGRHYLIAHNDYAGTPSSDLSYSSFSLSGAVSGATVFLSEGVDYVSGINDPIISDRVAYGTGVGNAPEGLAAILPEPGKSLFRISDSGDNATDFEIRTASPRNSFFESATEENPDESGSDTEESPSDEEDPQIIHPEGIIISEIMANPEGTDTGEEWVELYNSATSTIDLKDWILDDLGTNDEIGPSAYKIPAASIDAGSYLTITIPAGKFSLNNSSLDAVRLYWPDSVLASKLEYSGQVKDEQTWCRINASYQWCLATPNAENEKLPNPKKIDNDDEDEEEESESEDEEEQSSHNYFSDQITIIEIMPNPEGADAGQEYVKLYNSGAVSVQMKGWILDDGNSEDPVGSSALVLAAGTIEPGDELEIEIPKGKFAMNNSGADNVRLLTPAKEIKDQVAYIKAKEGIAYTKSDGKWIWQDEILVDENGEVLGADGLPRTGMSASALYFFATLATIWYIGGTLKVKKGTHEQARSNRYPGD
jgi:hypothetical protein